MRSGVLFLRPPDRQPVWIGPRLGLWDVQGQIPRNWCCRCGKEVFLQETNLCSKCEKEEKVYVRDE